MVKSRNEFSLGVVIGKFLPPHRGHHFLIDTALSRCEKVVVFVCEKASDSVPGKVRQSCLREMHPSAEVSIIDDRYDESDSRIWAENTIRWLGCAPDAVFTSESYGDAYAAHMGCRHVLVDLARNTIPCSGTLVRAEPFLQWKNLSPSMRAWYAKRVVVLGAESTGTTTLAQDLAAHFETNWVPEFGREYSQEKLARGEFEWRSEEFLEIAHEQTKQENAVARESNCFLICDTNSFATTIWHWRYMGFDFAPLTDFANNCRADLYILTGAEIPFVQDGLRDGESIRHEMHGWFLQALERQKVPWIILRGGKGARLKNAVRACRDLGFFSNSSLASDTTLV